MLRLYIPAAVTFVLIASFTYWESIYSDRFVSSSVTAAEFGERFQHVPKELGSWVGQDMKEQEETLEMAGAVNHVSRRYTNTETGQTVDLWLVVGHARDICRHTPDICYPSHGFSQIGTRVKQRIEPPSDPDHPATFFTAKFRDESQPGGERKRVFWAWNGNEEGKDEWEAPEYQKQHYGNNTALYKMYFTAAMGQLDEGPTASIALRFAEEMLPEINRALFPERYGRRPSEADSAGEPASAGGSVEDLFDAPAESGE
jgi:hypothetical protein